MSTIKNSTKVFAQIERKIYAAEKKRVISDFYTRDVFCEKDKRYKKFKGLKKILYFVYSLWYISNQNEPKLLEKEKDILKIIKEYNPQIKQQLQDYEKYFFQWENNNRSGGGDLGWIRTQEKNALERIDDLFEKEQKKLKTVNEMIELYHPISSRLRTGQEGWLSVENSFRYLDFLESFFEERIKKLSI